MRTKLQIPGGMPGGGMVTRRIEPCITSSVFMNDFEAVIFVGTMFTYKNVQCVARHVKNW